MADPPVLQLLVEKGPRKGESLQCPPGAVTRIGRVARGNALAVRDAGASQQHLAFEFLPASGRWAVSDLGSSNGTLLNGASVAPAAAAPLADGDVIKIGESTVISVSLSAAPYGRARSARHAAVAIAEGEVEGVVVRRGGRRRAAPPPPPPPPARARSKKGEASGGAEVEEEVVVEKEEARVPRRAVTRAAARKGKEAILEEEEEVAPLPRRGGRRGRPLQVRSNFADVAKVDEWGAKEEVLGELEEEQQVVPVPLRAGRRGRLPKAMANSADVVKVGEEGAKEEVSGEQEEQEEVVPGPQPVGWRWRPRKAKATSADVVKIGEEGEEKAALGEGKGDMTIEDMEERTVLGSEQEGGRASVGGGEGTRIGRTLQEVGGDDIDLDQMTLGEWFDRMEWYLPQVINDIAEQKIAALQEKARLFDEHVAASSDAA